MLKAASTRSAARVCRLVLLAAMVSCAHAPVAGFKPGISTPSGSPTSPSAATETGPPAPMNSTLRPLPSGSPDPGSPFACKHVPFPGAEQYQYQTHDCWRVDLDDDHQEFFLGGTDPYDRKQGVLFVLRRGSSSQTKFDTPRRTGDVTLFFARWTFACFTTTDGGVEAFDVSTRSFMTTSRASSTCPRR